MKRAMYGLVAVIVAVGLVGCTTMGVGKKGAKEGLAIQGEPGPTVIVATPMVKMDKEAEVSILGTGFKPGQEVSLLFTTMDGVQSDIGYALKPKPVANKTGAWVTTWSCGHYIAKKLVKEGAYTITVTNSDYNVLAQAPIAFYKAEEKKK